MNFTSRDEVARAVWTFPVLGGEVGRGTVAEDKSERSFSTPRRGWTVGKCSLWRIDCWDWYSSMVIGSCAHC